MDTDMQTKENAAALEVFSSHTVIRRACGGRSTNGGVFAPPFTLPIRQGGLGITCVVCARGIDRLAAVTATWRSWMTITSRPSQT